MRVARWIVLALALLAPFTGVAQPVVSEPAAELGEIAFQQALKDLGNDLRLLCVAAHPDDEDGATLTYHRFKYGIETHVLICTRGEGGQNEIGPELYEDLAVIRTKEMQDAAKIEGAQLHFLDMPEFGYSKTLEETLAVWGEEELVRRMVRKIREIRPHVIITHHGKMKDHGHHQAVGWALKKAFDLAGDAAACPDEGKPWQPQRLFIRDLFGQSETATAVDISEIDALRGKTYAEIHAESLRAHKSQGMEFIIERLLNGRPKAYYELEQEVEAAGDPLEVAFGPLFTGVRGSFSTRATALMQKNPTREETLAWITQVESLAETDDRRGPYLYWKLLSATTDFETRLIISDRIAVPGQPIDIALLAADLGMPGEIKRVKDPVLVNWPGAKLPSLAVVADTAALERTQVLVADDMAHTIPHARYVREKYRGDVQASARPMLGPDPANIHWLYAAADIEVAPPVLPEFRDSPYLLRHGVATEVSVPVKLTNYTPGAHTQSVTFGAPEGWVVEPASVEIVFAREDEEKVITLAVRAPEGVAPGSYTITADTETLCFTEDAQVAVVDFAPPPGDPLIGIVDSYDVQFRAAMDKMGVRWEAVTEQDFTPERLDRYDVLLVDMRSYLYRPDLKANNAAALAYVERGGTMIVNYHKTFDWAAEFAPHRLVLSNNRVTREDAPVTLREPQHPVWTTPNAIGPADWEGWRQERGLYFAGEWDDAYTPLLETSDPDEVIPPGAMLIADHGEGKYLYTALVWYRQLRELNPGAVRIFANMLAL